MRATNSDKMFDQNNTNLSSLQIISGVLPLPAGSGVHRWFELELDQCLRFHNGGWANFLWLLAHLTTSAYTKGMANHGFQFFPMAQIVFFAMAQCPLNTPLLGWTMGERLFNSTLPLAVA